MENTALLKSMLDEYNAKAFTHNYIFGFTDRHNVYAVTATSEILPLVCSLSSASRGGGQALRFRPNKAQKEMLKLMGAKVVCSVECFKAVVDAYQYNKGDTFEMLFAKGFGQEWEKNSTPFTKGADITHNGIGYQVKFEGA